MSLIRGLFAGISVGMFVGMSASLYYLEIVLKRSGDMDGLAAAFYGLASAVPGAFIGAAVSYLKRNSRGWRIVLWILAIPAILQISGLLFFKLLKATSPFL